MHTLNASGRRVSLLNDDARHEEMPRRPSYPATSHVISQPYHQTLARSGSSSPSVPQLLRSDSYDSQMSSESLTPLTPYGRSSFGYAAVHEKHPSYGEYIEAMTYASGIRRASVLSDSRSSPYEDEVAMRSAATKPATERCGKRYPCRYRESHGCEKTFTTSGHASRHSKIHTAEKAVPCTYPGCNKKFTRADNMKQHLDTHYKDKSRSSTRPCASAAERRSSAPVKSVSSARKAAVAAAAALPSPIPSPVDTWDMRSLQLPLSGPPGVSSAPSSGLDALAMAIACQEGA